MTWLRALLGLITRPTLKGVAPAGNLNHIFMGKIGQNGKKIGTVIDASETIQNCKKFYRPYRHFKAQSTRRECKENTRNFKSVR